MGIAKIFILPGLKLFVISTAIILSALSASASLFKEISLLDYRVLSQEVLYFNGRQLNKVSHYPDGFVLGEDIGLAIILNEDFSISIDLRKKNSTPSYKAFKVTIPFEIIGQNKGEDGFGFSEKSDRFLKLRGGFLANRITISGFSLSQRMGLADFNLLKDKKTNSWNGFLRSLDFRTNQTYNLSITCVDNSIIERGGIEKIISEVWKK